VSESAFVGQSQALEQSPPFVRRWSRAVWVNLVLFTLTLVSTTVFGFALVKSFHAGQSLNLDAVEDGYDLLLHGGSGLWRGLEFSIPLLCILLAHEFGHYIECRRWRVDATLPYFLPSPTLLGTLGAFIRIRSPIYFRQALFDIGVSGPLAGFVVLLPFLISGIWMSRTSHGLPSHNFEFATPLLMRLVEQWRFPGVPAHDIILHPVAMAAWGGLLATAINLLPIGQLDGGHIVYAMGGEQIHRRVSTAMVLVLVVLGFQYWAWWVWAVAMFFLGRRHALIYDQTPLPRGRRAIGALALLILLLSISAVPVRTL
jgi:hypothetical protein